MFLEIASNNGTKYIRVCESIRVLDPNTHKSVPKKKTVKNIGPVTKFDDGQPGFVARLKASYTAGNPILDELKPYVSSAVPQEVYNIRLCEGTDDCVAHPRLISNLLFEKLLEDLDVAQLIRSYKTHYHVGFDVYGFFKLLLFGRILNPASKWSTVKQNKDYAIPIMKGDIQEFNVYRTLDFIYEHRGAIFNRINTAMVKHYHRTTNRVYYDVTNFFFETDEPDEDTALPDGTAERSLRKKGVSKEHRDTPIVQMGLLMDEQGIPISIECFPGNTLDHQTLSASFRNSVDSIKNKEERFVYVCDKGIGKGESIVYAISNGVGYITSRSVRGSSAAEKKWIANPDGYTVLNENFKYKTKIVKKTTTTPEGVKLEYPEKVLAYWSRKYYEREIAERDSFCAFVQEYLKDPNSYRISATQLPIIRKYLKKDVVNKKTGEILNSADLTAMLDVEKLQMDYDLMGYYTLATSEINMDDQQIISTYGNLVEIEDQFRVMKSVLDTRPIYVRSKEHIVAHLAICTVALILLRLIQRQIKEKHPELKAHGCLFSPGMTASRIQTALNKWKIEAIGDTYYRFCDIDDSDLSMILSAFNIEIPRKCYKISEVKQLKSKIEMSM